MVQIVPAIDLINGRVVRLAQGDFSRSKTYPFEFAELVRFCREKGFERIHVVDLDGAKAGSPQQLELLRSLSYSDRACIEWSGGVRSVEDIARMNQLGLEGIMLGSVCVNDPELASEIQFRSLVPVRWAIDIRGSNVATNGWTKRSTVPWRSVLQEAKVRKVTEVMISSIDHDGMGQGPNLDLYSTACQTEPSVEILASGGVRNSADLEQLRACGVSKAVVGKAWLENSGAFL